MMAREAVDRKNRSQRRPTVGPRPAAWHVRRGIPVRRDSPAREPASQRVNHAVAASRAGSSRGRRGRARRQLASMGGGGGGGCCGDALARDGSDAKSLALPRPAEKMPVRLPDGTARTGRGLRRGEWSGADHGASSNRDSKWRGLCARGCARRAQGRLRRLGCAGRAGGGAFPEPTAADALRDRSAHTSRRGEAEKVGSGRQNHRLVWTTRVMMLLFHRV
jgi:hypothetical protein